MGTRINIKSHEKCQIRGRRINILKEIFTVGVHEICTSEKLVVGCGLRAGMSPF